MTESDPSPIEILSEMLSEAGDDQEGEWRVRIPTSPVPALRGPTFAEAVEIARQAIVASQQAGSGSREAVALSGLLMVALARHESGRCECGPRTQHDPICTNAQDLATAIAGF